MAEAVGILDSLIVALALGGEAVNARVEAARSVGVELVICRRAPARARAVLRKIGRPEIASTLFAVDDELSITTGGAIRARVIDGELRLHRFRRMLEESRIRLPARESFAGYQVALLALAGINDVLAADDGKLGAVRTALAAIEPFGFLATGTLACRDGVAALSLAAPAPRGAFLSDRC